MPEFQIIEKAKTIWDFFTGEKISKPMEFKVGEGLTPEQARKAQEVITKPTIPVGEEIKLPFIQKAVTIPKGPIEEIIKYTAELPEKVARSIAQTGEILAKGGALPEIKGKSRQPYQVSTYQEDAQKIFNAVIEGDLPLVYGALPFVQVPLDISFLSSTLASGRNAIIKGLQPANEAKVAAWEFLGKPAEKELSLRVRELQQTFHPDKPFGDAAVSSQINQAYDILKQGMPSMKEKVVSRLLPTTTKRPVMTKGLLPERAGTIPERGGFVPKPTPIGLTIQERPAKPIKPEIPKELPLEEKILLKKPQIEKFLIQDIAQISGENIAKSIQSKALKYENFQDFFRFLDPNESSVIERLAISPGDVFENVRAMGKLDSIAKESGITIQKLLDTPENELVKMLERFRNPEKAAKKYREAIDKLVETERKRLEGMRGVTRKGVSAIGEVPRTRELPEGRAGEVAIKRPPSLEKLGLKEKAPLITKREDVLLRARIKAEMGTARIVKKVEQKVARRQIMVAERQARREIKETRRLTREELITKFKNSQETIKNIKNDLIKYIDENLPIEAKGKLNQVLTRDNLTRKNAASIFSRVERMKETLTRKELVGKIKELSVPKGNLAVDYQKQVSEIIGGIDLIKPTEATLKKLKGLRDYIQKEGVPLNIQSKYIEKLDRLTKKNVSELTTDELIELRDTLTQLQKLGKLKQNLKYKYNERERKIALDKLIASTQNIDPQVSGEQTKLDIYKIGTKKVYMDTLHTPRVADMIDGFKNYQGENAKYIKQLGKKETNAKETIRTTVNFALEEIQNVGIKELTEEQQIKMMINLRHREGAFDQVKTLMEKNNLKEIPQLTNEENQVIEIIKKYINQNTDDIAAIFEEIENKPFHKLKEYILPIKYEKEFNLIPSQTIEQGRFRTTQTFKGFTFERQKGVEKIPRTDILAIFEEAINSQQWYLKMQPELENIKYLVKSEEYLARGGEMASNWWRTELDVVARRGWSATARSNPILRQGRINLNQAILGYKLSSVLMQPFAVFDAMAYTQSRYGTMATLKIVEEFSKAWIIPKYAKNFIAESPALQLRQAGELAIEETLKKIGTAKGLVNNFIRGGMSLLQKADVRTAAGVEKGLLNILEKYGVPNVKEEAEFLMNLASGSAEVVYRPHILASGEGARTWFTFQTFFLNRWGIMTHDIIQSGLLKAGGEIGWKGFWKRISALIGLGIFVAGSIAEEQSRKFIYETTTSKELPDESTAKIAIMAIPKNIPYFGNLIEAADKGGDADPPIIRTVENIFKGGASIITGKKPETKIKGALKMTEAGIALGTGIPGTAQFFDLLENIFGKIVSETKPRDVLSEYGIEKTKIQKRNVLKEYDIK